MAEQSISEAKFALQEVLMNTLGLDAMDYVDAIDAAKDKASLLEAAGKVHKQLTSNASLSKASAEFGKAWMRVRANI